MNYLTNSEVASPHRPKYVYCSDPEICCGHWEVVAIECAVCHEGWPCSTKRKHHAAGWNARIERWVNNRVGRPPIGPNGKIDYLRMPYHLATKYKARDLAKDANQPWEQISKSAQNWYLGEATRVLYPPDRSEVPRR